MTTNILHKGDLPNQLNLGPIVAIDCETMGLNFHRDRLCLVQLSGGDGITIPCLWVRPSLADYALIDLELGFLQIVALLKSFRYP